MAVPCGLCLFGSTIKEDEMDPNIPKLAGVFFLCFFLFVAIVAAQDGIIDFESDRWELKNAEIVQHMERKCLMGNAFLKDVEFENGVIEVDIAVDGKTSYPGILFRMQSEKDYERFYIRPHRAGRYPDALQYTPGFNGIDGWQLYNGNGCTAGAEMLTDRWVHLKMEVFGTQAKVFLGDAEQPALIITDLKHGVTRGTIGLMGPKDKTAYFSNFKYRIDNTLRFDPPPEIETPLGMFTEWELSQAFDMTQIDLERTPEQQGITEVTWRKVESDPSGLVDIARYEGRRSIADCVFARTTIKADKDTVLNLKFGYSDAVFVFLNSDLVFFGNSAYRQRDPSFLGIIGLNDAVYLPLKKGDNELLLLVAESFGGWGFMCQDGNAFFQHESLTKSWELPRKFRFPESVVYDRRRGLLYVSNYFLPGRGFISKVNPNGEVEELEWITGLNRPAGLWIFRDKLYAVDRANLIEINIDSDSIENRYSVPGAVFINDVAFDSEGNAYITDSQASAIYKFSNGEFEVWLQGNEIDDPNGLFVDRNKLIVGNSGDGCLKAVDLEDKKVSTIVCLGKGSIMDGVRPDGKGNYIISDYYGRVFLVSASGQKTELLNTKTPQLFCADLEYIPEQKLLVIPTLYDNRLMTYRLNR
jgi:sugar lactone lactonase YvrE